MITRVGIVAKPGLVALRDDLPRLVAWLEARAVRVCLDHETATLVGTTGVRIVSRDDMSEQVDLVVLLGGDGTLLGMADRIARAGRDVPILGVNFGGLGFLTEIKYDELYPALESVLAGTAAIDARLMLRAVVTRGSEVLRDTPVLNEVALTGGSLSRVVEFGVRVGGNPVATFHADGIIISTPTGSTAYNLSAGGPIVHPAVHALVLNPIAPHTLTNRPVVIPASADVEVRLGLRDREAEAFVTFDGRYGDRLEAHDVVLVQAAPTKARLVRAAARSYYDVLRLKLRWAER
ncbi:MAG TPA: NAD(+)/NADH kinase [Vicinamibacterales bacterium]|nr:NAD(+)/NADH kinase [Vicinamibacterales bacterium]HOQ59621.1 NAD(+)/NADH kinase [Vicinamibacterales bacterium]HPK72610.1 NAD(+)/NADH kinase [Vicinamibacterales bacterium]